MADDAAFGNGCNDRRSGPGRPCAGRFSILPKCFETMASTSSSGTRSSNDLMRLSVHVYSIKAGTLFTLQPSWESMMTASIEKDCLMNSTYRTYRKYRTCDLCT